MVIAEEFTFIAMYDVLEKPKLWLDGIIGRKIKVRAGEPINIDIPISGAPVPTIEWHKGTIPIAESNRVYVS